MKKRILVSQIAELGIAGAFGSISAMAADPAKISWSKIPSVTVGLFYPGQSSH